MNFLHLENPDNLMLINIIYHRGRKETNWEDSLDIVYKDLDTMKKKIKNIKSPTVDVYLCREEYRDYKYNKRFMELEKLDKVPVPYKNILQYIANEAGGQYKDYYYNCIQTKQWQKRNNLHKWRYIFGSDLEIEQWYRVQWYLNYNNDRVKPITRAFLDIEADIIGVRSFPKPGECPVNAITVIDADGKVGYTLLLNNPENPQIAKFKNDIKGFINDLHTSYDDVEIYGKLDYKIFMYDDEKELIEQALALVNTIKADFVMIWNMRFDIPYLIARYSILGGNPADIFCHKDFECRELYFKEDKVNKKRKIDVANRGDFFHVSSYSVYYDQMILYAGLRKGRSMLRSNKLTYIAQEEIGDEKLDYSELSDLRHLPYVDYAKFVKYNIKDVLLMLGIDNKTSDIENLYIRSFTNATVYHKVFKQTSLLKTRGHIEHFEQGLCMGNNINIQYGEFDQEDVVSLIDDDDDDDEEDDVKFSGALVGDPRLNSFTGIKIYGARSMFIFDNVVDFDFSSMYPNVIITFNIAPNCMIAKLIIEGVSSMPRFDYKEPPSDKSKKKSTEASTKYDAGQDFIDNLLSGNVALTGASWFGLPEYDYIREEFVKRMGLKFCTTINMSYKDRFEEMVGVG